ALLAYGPAAIVPEGSDRFDGTWREGTIGTGPFRVTRLEPGQRLELEANPYYWRSGYPRSDGMVFQFRMTPQEIQSGFKSGRFSLAWNLFPTEVESLRREREFATRYRETPRLSAYYVVMNA